MSSFIRFAYTCGPFSRGLLQYDVQPCSKLGEYRQGIKLFGSDGEAKATCNPTIARSLGYYRPSKHVYGKTFDVLHGSLATPPPPFRVACCATVNTITLTNASDCSKDAV